MARKLTEQERNNIDILVDILHDALPANQRYLCAGIASALVRLPAEEISNDDIEHILSKYGDDALALATAVKSSVLDPVEGRDDRFTLKVAGQETAEGSNTAETTGADSDTQEAESPSSSLPQRDEKKVEPAPSSTNADSTTAEEADSNKNEYHEDESSREETRTNNRKRGDRGNQKSAKGLVKRDGSKALAKVEKKGTNKVKARESESRGADHEEGSNEGVLQASQASHPQNEQPQSAESDRFAAEEQSSVQLAPVTKESASDGASQKNVGGRRSKGGRPRRHRATSKKVIADSRDDAGTKDNEPESLVADVSQPAQPETVVYADEKSTSQDSDSKVGDTAASGVSQQESKSEGEGKSSQKGSKGRSGREGSKAPKGHGGKGGESKSHGDRGDSKGTHGSSRDLKKVPYIRRGGEEEAEIRQKIVSLDQRFWMNGWLLSHPGAYTLYERELTAISDALKDGMMPGDITRRQLAYQIGGDEKFFEYGSDGFKLLRAMGMEDLVRHRPMPKPDLLFHAPRRRKHMRVLVTENLDPWLDVRNLMYEDGRSTILGERIHAVVMGGGMPVLEQNRLSTLLDSLGADTVTVLYWGDIDRAGIDIMLRLKELLGDAYKFRAFMPAYQLMVQKAMERYPDPLDNEVTGQVNIEAPDISIISKGLSDEEIAYVQAVIDNCGLIPQEILTRRDL